MASEDSDRSGALGRLGRQTRVTRMRFRLLRDANGKPLQKGLAIVLLSGLFFGISGIPVVSPPRKDHSRPYPCQDHPCGCASADECWRHCCCMTNKQKVAWAQQHGVTPPDFVVAAAAKEEAEQPAQASNHDEGCKRADDAQSEEPACCRARHRHHDVAAAEEASGKQGKSESRVRLALNDLARQCRGLSQIIMLFAGALPCVVSAPWRPAEPVVGSVIEAAPLGVSADLSPPIPPPKLRDGVAA